MSKTGPNKTRRKRAIRNRYGPNPYGRGYRKWDSQQSRWVWSGGHWSYEQQKWIEGPCNWPPTAPLYFAYGSNLNIEQMSRRCPEATPVCKLSMPDWRLCFRGVADIEYAPGESVQGGLWRITGADEAALDSYEGVSSKLYLKDYFTIGFTDADGQERREKVLVYLMGREGGQYDPPGVYYLNTIRQGYKDFDLEETRLDETVANTPEPEIDDTEWQGRYYPAKKYGPLWRWDKASQSWKPEGVDEPDGGTASKDRSAQ